MNKRIKELAERAGWPADINEQDMYEIVGPKFAEEFAKLIVQECIEVINPYLDFIDDDAAEQVRIDIKEYFGAE